MNKDSQLTSFIKSISWRIVATLTTIGIAYFLTGEVKTALSIGAIEFVLKFIVYYAHERVWVRLTK